MADGTEQLAPGLPRKAKILVADDDRFYIQIFSDLIEGLGYESISAANGAEALEMVRAFRPDILIIDVVMPGMNGFEVTRRLKDDPSTTHIPIIIVTSLSDRGSKLKGLHSGADELLSKPVDEAEFRARIGNLLKVKKYEDYLLEHGRKLEGEVVDKTVQLERAFEKIRHGYVETVYRLTLAAEYRDKETGGHIRRISLYSQVLASHMGLPAQAVEAIFFGSPMHDVGKIGIPDSVLLKEGSHTPEEFEIMKTHSTIGANILRDPDSGILRTAREIALTHHERWDGKGYPMGLKHDEIPISGRIVHLVDIYDALRSKRPYKEAFDHERACGVIDGQKERFDPEVFKGFLTLAEEFRRLFDENRQEEPDFRKTTLL
jgi:putative two-component system response regulator